MAIDIIARGIAVGKADLVGGKVPAEELPGYVDDILEYDTFEDFPETGEEGKLYVDKATGYVYRWSGSMYIQVGMPQLDAKLGLIELTGESGTLTNQQLNDAEKKFAVIALNGAMYSKSLEDSDKIEFRSANFNDADNIVDSIAVVPHRIVITKATQAWEYVA